MLVPLYVHVWHLKQPENRKVWYLDAKTLRRAATVQISTFKQFVNNILSAQSQDILELDYTRRRLHPPLRRLAGVDGNRINR